MAPLLASLAANGLNLLFDAVKSKGQEVVEEKLGIKLTPEAIEKDPLAFKQAEIAHQEFLLSIGLEEKKIELEAEKVAQIAVTQRWQADMLSDSWLSKNIRPVVLIALLSSYFIFSVASAFGVNITQAYVELLAQMLMLVMGAYFAGRTVEKIVDMKERGK